MTRQIESTDAVFEIGAGTGAITCHIPRGGKDKPPLVVFEQDHHLAEYLKHRVGHARVIEGYFHNACKSLGELPDNLVILSSVPFKSLSGSLHFSTVEAICNILLESPKRRLIQYTYFNSPPFTPHYSRLCWKRLTRVWTNFPPATVWELRDDSSAVDRGHASV